MITVVPGKVGEGEDVALLRRDVKLIGNFVTGQVNFQEYE
jgi:hypothetical protein